ncbi:hypothetical protein P692DRAFT_201790140 [Suillus brevipes Sb2]|nr:hypothetical protein P692DRAFT_201790140 [Suillus brevipes Sb2]
MGEIISTALCQFQNHRGGPGPLQISRVSNDTTNKLAGEASVVSVGCSPLRSASSRQ